MLRRICTLSVPGVIAAAFAAQPASAALLSVDFNADASPTQAGFSGAAVGTFDKTSEDYTFGSYTVAITDLPGGSSDPNIVKSGSRDRSALPAASAAVSDLFRDFVFANEGDNARHFSLGVGGLEANTSYDITFYSFDNNASSEQAVTFTQIGTPAVTGSVSYIGSEDPTSLDDNRVTLRATTDATGAFAFEVLGTDIAVLNGFEVNVVPEPASMALVAAGAGIMMVRRRR